MQATLALEVEDEDEEWAGRELETAHRDVEVCMHACN